MYTVLNVNGFNGVRLFHESLSDADCKAGRARGSEVVWGGGSIPSRATFNARGKMFDLFVQSEVPSEFEHPNQIGWAIRARTLTTDGEVTHEELAPLGTSSEYVFRRKQEAELYYDTMPENTIDVYTEVEIVPVCIPNGKYRRFKMSWKNGVQALAVILLTLLAALLLVSAAFGQEATEEGAKLVATEGQVVLAFILGMLFCGCCCSGAS